MQVLLSVQKTAFEGFLLTKVRRSCIIVWRAVSSQDASKIMLKTKLRRAASRTFLNMFLDVSWNLSASMEVQRTTSLCPAHQTLDRSQNFWAWNKQSLQDRSRPAVNSHRRLSQSDYQAKHLVPNSTQTRLCRVHLKSWVTVGLCRRFSRWLQFNFVHWMKTDKNWHRTITMHKSW